MAPFSTSFLLFSGGSTVVSSSSGSNFPARPQEYGDIDIGSLPQKSDGSAGNFAKKRRLVTAGSSSSSSSSSRSSGTSGRPHQKATTTTFHREGEGGGGGAEELDYELSLLEQGIFPDDLSLAAMRSVFENAPDAQLEQRALLGENNDNSDDGQTTTIITSLSALNNNGKQQKERRAMVEEEDDISSASSSHGGSGRRSSLPTTTRRIKSSSSKSTSSSQGRRKRRLSSAASSLLSHSEEKIGLQLKETSLSQNSPPERESLVRWLPRGNGEDEQASRVSVEHGTEVSDVLSTKEHEGDYSAEKEPAEQEAAKALRKQTRKAAKRKHAPDWYRVWYRRYYQKYYQGYLAAGGSTIGTTDSKGSSGQAGRTGSRDGQLGTLTAAWHNDNSNDKQPHDRRGSSDDHSADKSAPIRVKNYDPRIRTSADGSYADFSSRNDDSLASSSRLSSSSGNEMKHAPSQHYHKKWWWNVDHPNWHPGGVYRKKNDWKFSQNERIVGTTSNSGSGRSVTSAHQENNYSEEEEPAYSVDMKARRKRKLAETSDAGSALQEYLLEKAQEAAGSRLLIGGDVGQTAQAGGQLEDSAQAAEGAINDQNRRDLQIKIATANIAYGGDRDYTSRPALPPSAPVTYNLAIDSKYLTGYLWTNKPSMAPTRLPTAPPTGRPTVSLSEEILWEPTGGNDTIYENFYNWDWYDRPHKCGAHISGKMKGQIYLSFTACPFDDRSVRRQCCGLLCVQNPNCRAFGLSGFFTSSNTRERGCHLFDGTATIFDDKATWALRNNQRSYLGCFVMQRPEKCQDYTLQQSCKYQDPKLTGSDGRLRTVERWPDQCAARCAREANCGSWALWNDGGCHIFPVGATLASTAGVTCGAAFQKTRQVSWVVKYATGYNGAVSVRGEPKSEFNVWMRANAYRGIVKRLCADCPWDHQHIYYRRKDNVNTWDAFETLLGQFSLDGWHSDWDIYSNYTDAIGNIRPWAYCVSSIPKGMSFPGGCAPSQPSSHEISTNMAYGWSASLSVSTTDGTIIDERVPSVSFTTETEQALYGGKAPVGRTSYSYEVPKDQNFDKCTSVAASDTVYGPYGDFYFGDGRWTYSEFKGKVCSTLHEGQDILPWYTYDKELFQNSKNCDRECCGRRCSALPDCGAFAWRPTYYPDWRIPNARCWLYSKEAFLYLNQNATLASNAHLPSDRGFEGCYVKKTEIAATVPPTSAPTAAPQLSDFSANILAQSKKCGKVVDTTCKNCEAGDFGTGCPVGTDSNQCQLSHLPYKKLCSDNCPTTSAPYKCWPSGAISENNAQQLVTPTCVANIAACKCAAGEVGPCEFGQFSTGHTKNELAFFCFPSTYDGTCASASLARGQYQMGCRYGQPCLRNEYSSQQGADPGGVLASAYLDSKSVEVYTKFQCPDVNGNCPCDPNWEVSCTYSAIQKGAIPFANNNYCAPKYERQADGVRPDLDKQLDCPIRCYDAMGSLMDPCRRYTYNSDGVKTGQSFTCPDPSLKTCSQTNCAATWELACNYGVPPSSNCFYLSTFYSSAEISQIVAGSLKAQCPDWKVEAAKAGIELKEIKAKVDLELNFGNYCSAPGGSGGAVSGAACPQNKLNDIVQKGKSDPFIKALSISYATMLDPTGKKIVPDMVEVDSIVQAPSIDSRGPARQLRSKPQQLIGGTQKASSGEEKVCRGDSGTSAGPFSSNQCRRFVATDLSKNGYKTPLDFVTTKLNGFLRSFLVQESDTSKEVRELLSSLEKQQQQQLASSRETLSSTGASLSRRQLQSGASGTAYQVSYKVTGIRAEDAASAEAASVDTARIGKVGSYMTEVVTKIPALSNSGISVQRSAAAAATGSGGAGVGAGLTGDQLTASLDEKIAAITRTRGGLFEDSKLGSDETFKDTDSIWGTNAIIIVPVILGVFVSLPYVAYWRWQHRKAWHDMVLKHHHFHTVRRREILQEMDEERMREHFNALHRAAKLEERKVKVKKKLQLVAKLAVQGQDSTHRRVAVVNAFQQGPKRDPQSRPKREPAPLDLKNWPKKRATLAPVGPLITSFSAARDRDAQRDAQGIIEEKATTSSKPFSPRSRYIKDEDPAVVITEEEPSSPRGTLGGLMKINSPRELSQKTKRMKDKLTKRLSGRDKVGPRKEESDWNNMSEPKYGEQLAGSSHGKPIPKKNPQPTFKKVQPTMREPRTKKKGVAPLQVVSYEQPDSINQIAITETPKLATSPPGEGDNKDRPPSIGPSPKGAWGSPRGFFGRKKKAL